MSSASISLATSTQMEEWETTNDQLLGIRANDPLKSIPSGNQQAGTFKMLTSNKRNFAGVFNRFGTEKESEGYDWNFMIQPFDQYKYIYDKAFENTSKTFNKWPRCIDYSNQNIRCSSDDYNDSKCMWAEICPYKRFLNANKWFKGTNDNHCKEGEFLKRGDTVAVYGFPVTDNKHGYNPEIHPAQQIWFRYKEKTNNEKKSYFLMFLQDASSRFGNWSGSPIYGQFLVAFSAKPSSIHSLFYTPVTMKIGIAHRDDLVTQNFSRFSRDADDGFSHSLVVDGKKIVTVNEDPAALNNKALGIQFTEITKLQDGTIQGYVQISMVLGDYDTDEIGVCVLELEVVKAKLSAVVKPAAN